MRITAGQEVQDFNHLKIGVAEALTRRGLQPPRPPSSFPADDALDYADSSVLRQLYWEFFRQGLITPGKDGLNANFPWFALTEFGRRVFAGGDSYFVHDVTGYEERLKKEVPEIDPVTLLYLKESLQAFRSDCILSSTVMLGVATEHTFGLLAETIDSNPEYRGIYAPAAKDRSILRRVDKFRQILEPRMGELPQATREGLITNFLGVQEIIRGFRNDSGHPSGKIVDREQAHALLLLFPLYCRKMYELMDFFSPNAVS